MSNMVVCTKAVARVVVQHEDHFGPARPLFAAWNDRLRLMLTYLHQHMYGGFASAICSRRRNALMKPHWRKPAEQHSLYLSSAMHT